MGLRMSSWTELPLALPRATFKVDTDPLSLGMTVSSLPRPWSEFPDLSHFSWGPLNATCAGPAACGCVLPGAEPGFLFCDLVGLA